MKLGALPFRQVREASGVAPSPAHKERVYWINDSGNTTAVYYGKPTDAQLQSFTVSGVKAKDTEALTMVKCPQGHCLVLADIGDNRRSRQHIELIFVAEQETFPTHVNPVKRVKLSYPDGAHDAEALVALPDGSLLLFSKELVLGFTAKPAGVYKASAQALAQSGDQVVPLVKLGQLPVPSWVPEASALGQVITDAAINPARGVVGLLTYKDLIEVRLDALEALPSRSTWTRGEDYQVVPLKALAQQETVMYSVDGRDVVWSTEYFPLEAPIFSMTCLPASP